MCELIIGSILGFVANLITALLVSYWQFHFSTAHDRLEKTVEATERIIKSQAENRYTGALRDEYKDSLGVIIDIPGQIWDKDGFKENVWPCLVHFKEGKFYIVDRDGKQGKDADRWDLFEQYIRPVIQDISSYAFLGWFGWCPLWSKLCQLSALTKLCSQLKTVVGKFDAAYEMNLVELAEVNNRAVIRPATDSTDSEDVKQLRCEYRKLYNAWGGWLKATHVSRN